MNSGMLVQGAGTRHGHLRRRRSRSRSVDETQQITLRKFVGPQRADLPEPEADRQDRPARSRRAQVIADGAARYQRRAGPGPQRARRRSCRGTATTSKTRSSSAKSWCSDDAYTSIHIEEFDVEIRETQAGPRGVHSRHPERQREGRSATSTRSGIVRIGTFVSAGRHPGRQGLAQEQDRTDAGREAAARDLRPRRRRREERLARKSPRASKAIVIDTQKFSRRMSLTEDERKAFEACSKDTEKSDNARSPTTFKQMIEPRSRRSSARDARPDARQAGWCRRARTAVRRPSRASQLQARQRSTSAATSARSRRSKAYNASSGRADRGAVDREATAGSSSMKRGDELRCGRAADGQGLRRDQARDLGRRQDGRPPR